MNSRTTLTDLESIQLRTTIAQFYENMNFQNVSDIDFVDNYRFTLPPFLHINENNNLTFIPDVYQQINNGIILQLTVHDLAELMGYITTTIRLLQIRYQRWI
jgi:hypothetical protein